MITVISGGTATNAILDAFSFEEEDAVVYVMPISDNGGSTWEIQRVFGGPAIGDIRSRIVRLVGDERLRSCWGHRIQSEDEWRAIIEGTSPVWEGVEVKRVIIPFLIQIDMEILKRREKFNFSNASLGNLFLTGLSFVMGDLEASIELMSVIGNVFKRHKVLPCINTNLGHNIVAELSNGSVVVGQNEISHPSASPLEFSKDVVEPLESPIASLYYITREAVEFQPEASEFVLDALLHSDTIIYSIGSLWTSLIPVLVLKHISGAIQTRQKRVLLINSTWDRETHGMTVVDIIRAIVCSLRYSKTGVRANAYDMSDQELKTAVVNCVDEVVMLTHGQIPPGDALHSLNLTVTTVNGTQFDAELLRQTLISLPSL